VSTFGDLVTQLDPAMAIVTAAAGDERAGCLIGFHAQCSIEPERYAVWLSKANHTYRVALHADALAVHFVGDDDLELARLFGTTSGDEGDKFARCDWQPDASGVPLLTDCPDRFVARKTALLDEGSDHVCVILEPVRSWTTGRLRPLRFSTAQQLEPGHESRDRPAPADLRSAPDRRD
jgi:flavin reductase (DIM6/NTAB) family NADH-FMN oxidoreductase RutF